MSDDLPGALAEIAEIVGRDAALGLALAMGGQQLHVPHASRLEYWHPLCCAIGRENAIKLAGAMCGEKVYLPRARRALVVHLAARGMPTGAIARALGLSTSAVSRYRRPV